MLPLLLTFGWKTLVRKDTLQKSKFQDSMPPIRRYICTWHTQIYIDTTHESVSYVHVKMYINICTWILDDDCLYWHIWLLPHIDIIWHKYMYMNCWWWLIAYIDIYDYYFILIWEIYIDTTHASIHLHMNLFHKEVYKYMYMNCWWWLLILTYMIITLHWYERYLWGFERIIRREMNRDQKHTTRIWTIWRTHYSCLPVEHVFTNRACHHININVNI